MLGFHLDCVECLRCSADVVFVNDGALIVVVFVVPSTIATKIINVSIGWNRIVLIAWAVKE